MRAYFILLLIFLQSTNIAIACSRSSRPHITKHNTTEYFFEGQVVGYTSTKIIKGLGEGEETWGWKMVVSKLNYVPAEVDTVEVYGYNQTPGCQALPRDLEDVKQRGFLGKKVIVMARKAIAIEQDLKSGVVRLETGISGNSLGIFQRINPNIRDNPVRMKEVMCYVATAERSEVEMKIHYLGLARKYYNHQTWHFRPEMLEDAKIEELKKEIAQEEDILYTIILLRYLKTEEEELLAEELARLSLPGIPEYYRSEQWRAILKEANGIGDNQ